MPRPSRLRFPRRNGSDGRDDGARRKHPRHLETFVCSVIGHAVPVFYVRTLRPQDAGLGVDLPDGRRFGRCTRCDAWKPVPIPPGAAAAPPVHHPHLHRFPRQYTDTLPPLDELEVPRRGKELRDAVILRAIAINRAIHAVGFTLLAVGLFILETKLGRLREWAQGLLDDVSPHVGETGQQAGRGWLVRQLDHILDLKAGGLKILLATAIAYAVVEGIEAVGLWRERRWAEYLTVIATAGFIPFEIHELTKKVTVVRVGALVINVAMVAWIVRSKGLFGIGPNTQHDREMIDKEAVFGPPGVATVAPETV